MALFIMCWAPFLIYCIVCVRNRTFCLERQTIKNIFVGALALFYVNSVVNPIVYAVRFRGFNVALRLMLGCVKEDERHALVESVNSV